MQRLHSAPEIVDSLEDQIGADTASISGYVNIFKPIYEKQQPRP